MGRAIVAGCTGATRRSATLRHRPINAVSVDSHLMHTVQLSEIIIPSNRQRREFDEAKLVALRESIESVGLLQPIVVRENEDDKTFYLVAGERRLRAVGELSALGGVFKHGGVAVRDGYVPVVTLGELDALSAWEAELAENTCRSDLTWQEQSQAVAALHALRAAQRAAHTVNDTIEEVRGRMDGGYQDNLVRQQIILADHLANPAIQGAKSAKEAFKILRREETNANFAALSVQAGRNFGRHSHRAVHGDCLEFLSTTEPAQFDVIVTDPPYGMGADSFGDGAGRLTGITHEYSDDEQGFRTLMERTAPLLTRVAKDQSALYLCCDPDQFHWLRTLFRGQGWYVFRTPLINVKSGSGRVPLPEHGPRRQYEICLYAFRGGRKVNSIQSDVITTLGDEQLGHGAQKPVELFRNLLARSCRPGDLVLDPFAGTGTIFPAAHELKCAATGIEQEAAYYGMCVQRIEELK